MSVRTAAFTEVVRDVSSGNAKLLQSEFQKSGALAVVDQGQNFIAGFTDDETCRFRSETLPVVVFGDHTKAIKYIDFPFAMGADGVKVLKPTAECDVKFLYHFLRQARIPDAGYSRHYKFLKELRIPLPPLPEQRRIAAILDKADALRAKRREAIDKLDQLLQSVFLDMFGDPVTNPKKWPVYALSELLARKACSGAYFPLERYVTSGGVQMVHMSDAFYGAVSRESLRRVEVSEDEIEKYRLTPDDILVSRRSLNYEGSAKPCLIPESPEPLIFESSLIRVTVAQEKVLPLYMFHYLNNPAARRHFVFKHVTRSTISGISQAGLNSVEVVTPDISVQKRFELICAAISKRASSAHQHATILDKLQGSLMYRAFSGTL